VHVEPPSSVPVGQCADMDDRCHPVVALEGRRFDRRQWVGTRPSLGKVQLGRVCPQHESAGGQLQPIDKDLRPSANEPAGDAPTTQLIGGPLGNRDAVVNLLIQESKQSAASDLPGVHSGRSLRFWPHFPLGKSRTFPSRSFTGSVFFRPAPAHPAIAGRCWHAWISWR
jgi:hypothetical protein